MADIVHALNRTPEAVRAKVSNLGFTRPRVYNGQPDFISTWTPELLSALKEGWQTGEPMDQISARVGKGKSAIYRMAKRMGCKRTVSTPSLTV